MSLAVSVVLPVRDGARWLERALDSIAAQTRSPAEVVVVDDGSRDDSRQIAEARPFATVVDGPQAGIARAYATAISHATGDAVAFLGQDDAFAPTALASLAGALEADPVAGLACGKAQMFTDHEGHFSGLREDRLDRPYLARVPEATLVRRPLLERVGVELTAATAWDVDLFLRLDESGARTAWVDELVVSKRLRPDSAIHSSAQQGADMLAALRRSIVRRRAEGGGVIGIVVVVCDQAEFVGEALDSIAAQTEPAAEVVVVDDRSQDASGEIAVARGLRTICTPRVGPGAARNAGAALLSTPLLCFLDGDDRLTPDHHRVLRAGLGDADAALGLTREFAHPPRAADIGARFAVRTEPRLGRMAGAFVVRRETFDRVGRFADDNTLHEAFDFFARLLSCRELDDVVLERRIHGDNLTIRSRDELHARYLASARAAIVRRRTG